MTRNGIKQGCLAIVSAVACALLAACGGGGGYGVAVPEFDRLTGFVVADLVTASPPGDGLIDSITWLRAAPSRPGHFESARTLKVGSRMAGIAVAVLDRDGLPDIVFGDRESTDAGAPGNLVVLRNDPLASGKRRVVAQLDRQVSGNEFSGLVDRTRPISDSRLPYLAAVKLPLA
jgi:hypothetical protein